MSAELQIPDGAIDALGSRFIWGFEAHREAEDLIRQVAAPVVAAELRRMAPRLCTNDARDLLARADELDGAR